MPYSISDSDSNSKTIEWYTYINDKKIIVDAIGRTGNDYYREVFTCIGKHLVIGVNLETGQTVPSFREPVWRYVYTNKN